MPIERLIHYFWIKESKNFVAVKFTTPTVEKVTSAFESPDSDKIDRELVAHFKTLVVGDAIEINFKESGLKTERSLKVNVNKMAKLAKRNLDWRNVDGNFIARIDGYVDANGNVTQDNPDAVTTNGTSEVKSEEVTVVDTPLQEPVRGRR